VVQGSAIAPQRIGINPHPEISVAPFPKMLGQNSSTVMRDLMVSWCVEEEPPQYTECDLLASSIDHISGMHIQRVNPVVCNDLVDDPNGGLFRHAEAHVPVAEIHACWNRKRLAPIVRPSKDRWRAHKIVSQQIEVAISHPRL